MRRRDVLAGVGSLGVLAGAGVLVSRGLPSFGDDTSAEAEPDDSAADGVEATPPFEIETIDATGSEEGSITIPGENDVVLTMFFMPTCGICQSMMGVLGRVRNAVDDDRVTFLGAVHPNFVNTTDMTADELASWWDEYDGDWPVGIASSDAVDYYDVYSHPITAVLGADDEVYLNEHGELDRDVIVDSVEEALESVTDGAARDDEDSAADSEEGSA